IYSLYFIVRRHHPSTLFPYTTLFRSDPLRVGSLTMTNLTTVQIGLFPNRPGGGATNDSIVTSNAPTLGGAVVQVTAITNLAPNRSEEHTSELQSLRHLVCRLLLEKKK